MIDIRSLDGLSFDELYNSFQLAFADYAISFGKEDLRKMHLRRGFDAKLSFGAFSDGKLVSFTFNGVGEFDGKRMAYDTGTGTIAEYRGLGLAGKIFEHAVPYLQADNISHYILEVLQENEAAINVYKKQGFDISREFNCYMIEQNSGFISTKTISDNIDIRPIKLADCLDTTFHDFIPSWQNSFASIERATHYFVILGAYADDRLVAYCIFDPQAGDISQLAVDTAYRQQGIGSALLQAALQENDAPKAKILNVDTRCQSVAGFMHRLPISSKQYEMIRKIV